MALIVLRERSEEFVESSEIFSAIKARWWGSATKNDVLPTLWRLAIKDNRLRKEGSRYGLPIREGMRDPTFAHFAWGTMKFGPARSVWTGPQLG